MILVAVYAVAFGLFGAALGLSEAAAAARHRTKVMELDAIARRMERAAAVEQAAERARAGKEDE